MNTTTISYVDENLRKQIADLQKQVSDLQQQVKELQGDGQDEAVDVDSLKVGDFVWVQHHECKNRILGVVTAEDGLHLVSVIHSRFNARGMPFLLRSQDTIHRATIDEVIEALREDQCNHESNTGVM